MKMPKFCLAVIAVLLTLPLAVGCSGDKGGKKGKSDGGTKNTKTNNKTAG